MRPASYPVRLPMQNPDAPRMKRAVQTTGATSIIIYLLFVISWFIHLGTRLPLFGLIRFDLFMAGILTYLAISTRKDWSASTTNTDKLLRILVVYSILVIPFVQWPGSVISTGIPNFIKGIAFYYFTVAFVRTEQDLKKFIVVFVTCQLWRILEPLYLHVTDNYWGSIAGMANYEFMYRLSGAPSDVVNPNGLAFIICTVLPFLYLAGVSSWKGLVASILLASACIYTLALTGSRSGILGLVMILLGIVWKSKRRVTWVVFTLIITATAFPLLSVDMQDRYLSIIGQGEKNAETAEGRLTGVVANFVVALHKPIFGHGLGTSREANANYTENDDQPAHNLYAEIAQELGFVGLAIYLMFLKSIYVGFNNCKHAYDQQNVSVFLRRMVDCMQVLLIMNFLFSFASYGLSSYEWYFLGGISVVLQRLAMEAENRATAGRD